MCLYGDRQQGEIRRCVIIQRAAGQLKLSWGARACFMVWVGTAQAAIGSLACSNGP